MIFLTFILGLSTIAPNIFAQGNPNTVTFDNKSGEFGLVKLVGPSSLIVEVPPGKKSTVNVAAGEYYILVRYGSKPEDYKYSKGEKFHVSQTSTKYSAITITLHKVVGGNYETNPVSGEEFDSIQISQRGDEVGKKSYSRVQKPAEFTTKQKSEWLLTLDQTDDTIIKLIGKYIETFYDVIPKYLIDKHEKLVLTYEISSDKYPRITLLVECLPSWYREDKKGVEITERRVRISTYYVLPESCKLAANRNRILELNNNWHNKTWIPHRLYITEEGLLAMQSSINIPGKGFSVHAELVRDLIARTLMFWEAYSDELAEVLNHSVR